MGDKDSAELLERVRQLEEELAKERARGSAGGLQLRVSKKGGVSIYGLQRFPVTLYASQWLRILDLGDDIRKFINEHRDELHIRPERDE